MQKFFKSLPFKLLVGVIAGIVIGLVANETVMNVVVTIKQVLGQLITFCVPLIVIGFIAPSGTGIYGCGLWPDSASFHCNGCRRVKGTAGRFI